MGGAVRCSDNFKKILFHIGSERLEGDRRCQLVMDESLLKGHQGNNRQPSEPWRQQAKPGRSLLFLSSLELPNWKISAIRKYVNVKAVALFICRVLMKLWQTRQSERAATSRRKGQSQVRWSQGQIPKGEWIDNLRCLNCLTPAAGRLGKLVALVFYSLTIYSWLFHGTFSCFVKVCIVTKKTFTVFLEGYNNKWKFLHYFYLA